jgi:hypothetical protein
MQWTWLLPYRCQTGILDSFEPIESASVRNRMKDQASAAAYVMHRAPLMSEGSEAPLQFDRVIKLELVREFLHGEFRGCQHRDYYEFHTKMQVFVVEAERGIRHTLAITQKAFEDGDFGRLLSEHLATSLAQAGGRRLTLTPRGLRE